MSITYMAGRVDVLRLSLRLNESSLAASQVLPGNDEALDLGGSFINLVNFGITHKLLNRIFSAEAVASKDL